MSDEANAPSNGASESVQPVVDSGSAQTPVVDSVISDKPAPSARDALVAAFAKTEINQPEGDKPTGDRARDEAGRFAPKDAAAPVAAKTLDGKPLEVSKPVEIAPVDAAKPLVGQPPPGFTKAAQEAWAQTPEPVRADVERRVTELTQGLEKYKTEAAAFEPIRQFDQMARQSGTTLDKALANYVGMEQMLSRDFVGGVKHLCQTMNVSPAALAAALGQQGEAPQGGDTPEVATLKQQIVQLKQELLSEVGGIKQTFQEQQRAAQTREIEKEVASFAADHPYFDELSETVTRLLSTKFAKDLSEAYETAVRLTPEIAAKIEADKAAKAAQPDPAQTRDKAKLSITGTPSAGSHPATRKPAGSAREALQSAFSQVGLG